MPCYPGPWHRDRDKLHVRVHVLVSSKLSLMAENRGV